MGSGGKMKEKRKNARKSCRYLGKIDRILQKNV